MDDRDSRRQCYFKEGYTHKEILDVLYVKDGNVLSECLKFCFMGIIQQELDQVKQVHNTHRIKPYPNQECLDGRPNFIYNVPENFDTTNEIVPVTEMGLNNALSSDYYTNKSNFGCVPEFKELALRLMFAHNLTFPTNEEEVRQLYDNLLSYTSVIENS